MNIPNHPILPVLIIIAVLLTVIIVPVILKLLYYIGDFLVEGFRAIFK